MAAMTFFYQGCPVCGRSLRVPVKYFGRQMSCSHCHGEFLAGKDELPSSVGARQLAAAGRSPEQALPEPALAGQAENWNGRATWAGVGEVALRGDLER